MPLVSITKLSTPGNRGGRRRELSHLQVPDAGRGPADRTGGGCAPETPDRWLCGPPPRHRRRPSPQPHRPAGPRGLTLLRQAGSQLLPQRCFDRGSGSSAPGYRPAVSEAARGPRVHPSGVRPGDPRQPHRTPDSSDLHRPRLVQTSIGMLHPGAASRYTRAPAPPTPERRRTPTPCADERTPRAPAHTNREEPEGEERNVTIFPSIREQEQPLSCRAGLPVRTPGPEAAAPCPQQPPTDGPTTPQVASSRTTPVPSPATPPGPPRPLKDEFRTLPGAVPDRVRALAWRLGHHLRDTASVGFFVMVLSLVAAGSAPVERLMAAYVAADRSRGKAQKPGAIFVSVWSGWQPPLKPSEINRPVYCASIRAPGVCPQGQPSVTPPPAPIEAAPVGDEMTLEEEIGLWKQWSENKNHPFFYLAQQRMARLGEQATTL